MNLYEPNPSLERKVLQGLLRYPDFLRRFSDLQVKPEIFESEDSEHYRRISTMAVEYFQKYHSPMQVGRLLEAIRREEDERESDEAELIELKIKRVLKEVLKEDVRPAELPYHLDSLVELHKSYRILADAKELERFYKCRFEHGKHETCKGCSVWANCKSLHDSEKSFSGKIYFMQDMLRDRVQQATGSAAVQKSQASTRLVAAEDRYRDRMETRQAGGEGFTFGVPTPWPTVTKRLDGWKPKKSYGIWAPKKTGKTITLLMCAAEAIRAGYNVQVFAMEDDEDEWLDKFLCQQAAVEWDDFDKGSLSAPEYDRLVQIREFYEEAWEEGSIGEIFQYHRPLYHIGLEDIQAELDYRVSQGEKIGLVVIDHLHILKKPWRRDLTRDDLRLNHIAETLKNYAKHYEAPFIIAAQLKTSGERKGRARGSDQLEDSFDAVSHLEYVKGVMRYYFTYARGFAPFEIELENLRNRLLLPECEDESTTVSGEDLEISDEDWLG